MSTTSYKLSNDTCKAVIDRYILTGSPVIPHDKNSLLHWRIIVKCTLLNKDILHITLDMTVGGDGSKGVLCATEQRHELSRNSVADVRANATNPITVQGLLDLLESHGRNRYEFDSTGAGCRFWCRTVLCDLERGRFVASGVVNDFDAYIVKKNKGNPARYPLPTREGRFY